VENIDTFDYIKKEYRRKKLPMLIGTGFFGSVYKLNRKLFNNKIASQFAGINLLTVSAIQELNLTVAELNKFLTTIALVHDKGRTVFELTKSRFMNGNAVDPLSILYSRSHQLPAPVSQWAKQIADDTWFMFINESKNYLSQQWQSQVYQAYDAKIAHRFPFDTNEQQEIDITDFEQFFNPNGTLTRFTNDYLKPFMDTSSPQWTAKELDGYVLPISENLINELIRANIITKMFFPQNTPASNIEFSLQKIELDPVVASLQLTIGETTLNDNQSTESNIFFNWPSNDAKLLLKAIDGNHYELEETGPWAFFKILQKVNVLVDNADSASLQILFEVNGNSGRYLLKTQNQINPFSPGVLTGFNLYQELG
jgi:intracellular multiplication protein IcmF